MQVSRDMFRTHYLEPTFKTKVSATMPSPRETHVPYNIHSLVRACLQPWDRLEYLTRQRQAAWKLGAPPVKLRWRSEKCVSFSPSNADTSHYCALSEIVALFVMLHPRQHLAPSPCNRDASSCSGGPATPPSAIIQCTCFGRTRYQVLCKLGWRVTSTDLIVSLYSTRWPSPLYP